MGLPCCPQTWLETLSPTCLSHNLLSLYRLGAAIHQQARHAPGQQEGLHVGALPGVHPWPQRHAALGTAPVQPHPGIQPIPRAANLARRKGQLEC